MKQNIQILENKMDIMYEMLSINNDEEAFIKSVKSGQYEDTYTPSVRMLFDDELISADKKENNQQ